MVSLEEVKKLILDEIAPLKLKLRSFEDNFATLENSVDFFAKKYEELLNQQQTFMKNLTGMSKDKSEVKAEINSTKCLINNLGKDLMKTNKDLDDLGQYIRRDCVEIVGAKAKSPEECDKIVIAMAKDMGIALEPKDISTSHPLPTPKGKDDKFIVKFTRRDTKDRFYSNRKKVAGRKPCNLPTVNNVIPTSDKKLYVSESLTPLRKKLFGLVNDARKQLKWKFIWTNNGKVYVKKNEESGTTIIDSSDDLNKFKERYNLNKR